MIRRWYHMHGACPAPEHGEHSHEDHSHGGHCHEGHSHEGHCHGDRPEGDAPLTEKAMALRLAEHMWDHNEQHREEILQLAERFAALEQPAAADKLREAAARMEEVNKALHAALHLAEEE